jgi:hypothetical protein
MREKQKHIDAFDYFYQLGGAASAENCRLVAEKFQISERTFWNWYKKLGWKERVHLRNIDVGKRVEEKTNTTIADNKANYLSYVHKLFNDWKAKVDAGEVPVEIKSVSDVDKIVKLALLLQDEATDKTETKIQSEGKYEVTKRIICSQEHIDHELEVLNAVNKTREIDK